MTHWSLSFQKWKGICESVIRNFLQDTRSSSARGSGGGGGGGGGGGNIAAQNYALALTYILLVVLVSKTTSNWSVSYIHCTYTVTYIHTYIHTYTHTHIPTHIHTYKYGRLSPLALKGAAFY